MKLNLINGLTQHTVFRFANFQDDLSKRINTAKTGSGLNEYVSELFDASLSWDDVKWLKRYLRIIVCELSLSRRSAALDSSIERIKRESSCMKLLQNYNATDST